MLAQLGLTGFGHHYPQIVRGMRQRAYRNCHQSQLDPHGQFRSDQPGLVINRPFSVLGRRKTVVLVTHDLERRPWNVDRVLVMSARPGKIKAEYRIDYHGRGQVSTCGRPQVHRLLASALGSETEAVSLQGLTPTCRTPSR
jgi:ABC-type nitrate/sulfonate/bicarbonate transport system ATPase subunit